MFHQIIAMIALGVGGWQAPQELARDYTSQDQALDAVQRRQGRFWVQFRQPEWRDNVFGSPQEMDAFIREQQRNGWEVQVFPAELRVRYRLLQWGGSRIFDNLGEAQAWAAYLERDLGYQPRIVDR